MNYKRVIQFIVVLSLLVTTYGIGSAEYIYNMSPAAIDYQGSSYMTMDTFGDGLWASLKVESADCPSYCMVRVERYVGLYNGNRLRVEFRLGKWGDNNTIEYRVREMDFSGNTIRDHMRGYFGSSDGQNWTLGETVDLAVALEGSEFIFYVAGMGQIAKLQLLGSITPFQTPLAWRISIWNETANDYMEAIASDFKAIDVSEAVPVLPSLGIVGVWAMTEYDGPNTCGDPVGAYVDSFNMVIQDTGVVTAGDLSVNGFISGNTVSWTGNHSFQEDGATVTLTNINLTASSDGNTVEGSIRWSAVANGFSCNGAQNLTGIRNN